MITLSKCTLRRFRKGDELSLQIHADNLAIWNNLLDSFPYPFSIVDAVNWVSLHKYDPNPTQLAIVVDDMVVGGIGITKQSDVYRLNAELGYWLGESYWNRGVITEAVQGIVDYAFTNFKIIRIYARVFEYNAASMRVLEKAGFEKEAVHKRTVFKNGKVFDEHLYAILNPDAGKILLNC